MLREASVPSACSPNSSPAATICRMISLLSSPRLCIFTKPDSRKKSESNGLPSEYTVAKRRLGENFVTPSRLINSLRTTVAIENRLRVH